MRTYRYLIPITGLFTATLLISNTLETKVFMLGPIAMTAGTLIFPLAYIFNDILTEVYGFAISRKIIWTGFAALLLMSLFYQIAAIIPPAPFWPHQDAFAAILGNVPRIVLASITAYFLGEFVNSLIVAKMKVAMNGRRMWLRFAASTVIGQMVDTTVFVAIAFTGVYALHELATISVSMWAAKVLWEIIALPLTLAIVRKIKAAENEDFYDTNTNFNPFAI